MCFAPINLFSGSRKEGETALDVHIASHGGKPVSELENFRSAKFSQMAAAKVVDESEKCLYEIKVLEIYGISVV